MKIVRAFAKERKIGEYKWIYISTTFSAADMGARPGDKLELVVMTREEWARRQEEITMLYEKIKQYQQLITLQLGTCHQIVQLATLQLQSGRPQPVQQRRPRRGRRPRRPPQQRPAQPQQQPPQQRPPEPPIERLTVPTELTEKLLENQWIKILRARD